MRVMGEDNGYEFVEAPNTTEDRDHVFWVAMGIVLILLVGLSIRF